MMLAYRALHTAMQCSLVWCPESWCNHGHSECLPHLKPPLQYSWQGWTLTKARHFLEAERYIPEYIGINSTINVRLKENKDAAHYITNKEDLAVKQLVAVLLIMLHQEDTSDLQLW